MEDISLIANDRFVRKFVYAIIQNIRARNFSYEEKHVIHADLVPRFSEKVMQASLGEKVIPRAVPVINEIVVPKRDMSVLVAPIARPRTRVPARARPPQRIIPPMPQAQAPLVQYIVPPVAPKGALVVLSQDYGRITPLLNDPSVSIIECSGVEKPLMIIRAGQKMPTKISLSKEEIEEILHRVSDAVHIPLLEGVFRAAVDNFSINAVISEIVGSKFVIKKVTAYSLLEK